MDFLAVCSINYCLLAENRSKKQQPELQLSKRMRTGWWLSPSHSVCFLFAQPGLCMNTRLFSARTQNGQLAEREEIFAESDKKCIGLEFQTTPLTPSLKTVFQYSDTEVNLTVRS